MRIISLVPSLSEYLWALGLDEQVVGITKFCVHPNHWWREKTRVGGTKQVNFDAIQQLQPTLIIANKEENTKEDIERLQQSYEVLLTDINSIDDAFRDLLRIGECVHKLEETKELLQEIKNAFAATKNMGKGASFLYFIWQDPHFVVGPNTYIHSLLSHLGFVNFCSIERYPELQEIFSEEKEKQHDPDYIFLSSEPYPFKNEHIAAFQNCFSQSKVLLIDGEMCSWYGSRMLEVPAYFNTIFK